MGLSGLLFLLPCFFFEETLGKPLKDDIKEELKVLKKRKKKKEKLDTMDIWFLIIISIFNYIKFK